MQPAVRLHCMYTSGTVQVPSSSGRAMTKAGGLTSTSSCIVFISHGLRIHSFIFAGTCKSDRAATQSFDLDSILASLTWTRGYTGTRVPLPALFFGPLTNLGTSVISILYLNETFFVSILNDFLYCHLMSGKLSWTVQIYKCRQFLYETVRKKQPNYQLLL